MKKLRPLIVEARDLLEGIDLDRLADMSKAMRELINRFKAGIGSLAEKPKK